MHIVVAGYGIEGKQSVDYFLRRGHHVTVADERPIDEANLPTGVRTVCGTTVFEQLDKLIPQPDMVVRTAGLAPYKLKTRAKIWSATNEFFKHCPAPIIGVTGSKGKGTTCSLITSILRAAGKTVHLVGNIGVPALEQLAVITPDDIVVYELSSFQLWDCEYSPHVAVVLHIEPDHLDVHSSFADYINAKAHIVMFQTGNDSCYYHPNNRYSKQIAEHQPQFATQAAKYAVAENGNARLLTAYYDDELFIRSSGQPICSREALQLPGAHNVSNAAAALSACLAIMPEISNQAMERGLSSFKGLDHRLRYVATVNEVDYYDDSIATTPGSAIAAAKSFHQPKVMILGGSSKGADFGLLAQTLAGARIRQVLLIGEEAQRIAEALAARGVAYQRYDETITMERVVVDAAHFAQPGDVVVLSPACASFGMFKNYSDRGDQFIQAVGSLGNEGGNG